MGDFPDLKTGLALEQGASLQLSTHVIQPVRLDLRMGCRETFGSPCQSRSIPPGASGETFRRRPRPKRRAWVRPGCTIGLRLFRVTLMRRPFVWISLVLCSIVVIGIAVQLYLIAAWVFGEGGALNAHKFVGGAIVHPA